MFLYEQIFLGLGDKNHKNKIPRSLRILLALVVSIIYLAAIFILGFYDIVAVEEGALKRSIGAMSAVICLIFYGYLFMGIFKKV